MLTLVIIGLAAGLVTSISPCVLPVLPVILASGTKASGANASGAKAPGTKDADASPGRSWRPVGVVLGLVVSFSLATLLGTVVLSALGLPQDLLRDIGIAVLLIIGVSLLVPALARLLERPFARLPMRNATTSSNGIVLGLGLGLLYVPCAGPVLAAIAVVGATHRISLDAVALTIAFGVGAGIPLLVLALAGDALTRRTAAVRRHARSVRIASGAVMIVMALLIGFNLTDALQRNVPGYVSALQDHLGGTSSQLDRLTGDGSATKVTPASGNLGGRCTEGGAALENCGKAPNFTGIDSWLNTPGDEPLTMKGLRGKVVLVDFWTYSCINCQRALPHVEAWYHDYAKDGFVVVGVHTPEFAFEHVRSNVVSQSRALGVKYPVALDNEYGTWNAFHNQYWPADYLIDANGNIRHVSFGEGDYGGTETLIRRLLQQTHPSVSLPAGTDVPTATLHQNQTPETYLGTKYAPLDSDPSGLVRTGSTTTYHFPSKLVPSTFALSGTWRSEAEDLVAGANARLELSYEANKAYLVLGGHGSVTVSIPHRPNRTIVVDGAPRLYTLASAKGHVTAAVPLTLTATPGVQAYDFTFG